MGKAKSQTGTIEYWAELSFLIKSIKPHKYLIRFAELMFTKMKYK